MLKKLWRFSYQNFLSQANNIEIKPQKQESEDFGKPLELVYFDQNKGFWISDEGAKLLNSIEDNVGVIAVAGKYRTGK